MVTVGYTKHTCGRLPGGGRLCVLYRVRLGEQEICAAWMGGWVHTLIDTGQDGGLTCSGRERVFFLLVCFFIVVIYIWC